MQRTASCLADQAWSTSNFGAGGTGGERGSLRTDVRRKSDGRETMQALIDPFLHSQTALPFLIPTSFFSCSVSLLTHTHTEPHTQALAPWEMKMDDEHLAKQGCREAQEIMWVHACKRTTTLTATYLVYTHYVNRRHVLQKLTMPYLACRVK